MSKWLNYAEWNERNERMSRVWVLKVSSWLMSNTAKKDSKNILDYGCSYFDLGEILAPEFNEVHGFDIDQSALNKAIVKKIPKSYFHHDSNLIPDAKFDIIVISSVLQYFESLTEVEKFFELASSKLKKSMPSYILITDLIPSNYSSWKDALENLLFASQHGILLPMTRHLLKAALKKADLALLKIDKQDITQIAEKYHFKINFLESNLTPSKRRYTCICEMPCALD